jgi:hypothetical protein
VDGLLEAERATGTLDFLGTRKKEARELERNTARRRLLGVEVRVVRGSRAWRVLTPFARIVGRIRRR